MIRGKSFPYFRRFIFWTEGTANRTSLTGSCFMLRPLAGAEARPAQLVRDAVSSGTRRGYAVSGRRPGRDWLVDYRFALSMEKHLSVQLAISQNDDESRPCVVCTTPRADAICGTAKPFCPRAKAASALPALRRVLRAGTWRTKERTKRPVYTRRGNGTCR